MDKVLESGTGERLRNVKYTVLKRLENMSEYDAEKLSNIRLNNPELALAYDMKKEFCEILECTDMYEAQDAFEEWYSWVTVQECQEMRERAKMFKLKIDRILAWFDHRVNNGVAEAVQGTASVHEVHEGIRPGIGRRPTAERCAGQIQRKI